MVEAAYFQVPAAALQSVREAPAAMLIPLWLLIGANLYVGVDAGVITGIAQQGAATLVGQAMQ